MLQEDLGKTPFQYFELSGAQHRMEGQTSVGDIWALLDTEWKGKPQLGTTILYCTQNGKGKPQSVVGLWAPNRMERQTSVTNGYQKETCCPTATTPKRVVDGEQRT